MDKVELATRGAVLVPREKLRIHLASQVHFDHCIDRSQLVVQTNDARIIHVIRYAALDGGLSLIRS